MSAEVEMSERESEVKKVWESARGLLLQGVNGKLQGRPEIGCSKIWFVCSLVVLPFWVLGFGFFCVCHVGKPATSSQTADNEKETYSRVPLLFVFVQPQHPSHQLWNKI
jgi:hypothetical protein